MNIVLSIAKVSLTLLSLSPMACPGADPVRDASQIDRISTLAKEVNVAAEEGSRPLIAICEVSTKTGEIYRVNGIEQSLEAFLDGIQLLRGDKAKEVWVVCGIVKADGKVDRELTKKVERIFNLKKVMSFSVFQIELKI